MRHRTMVGMGVGILLVLLRVSTMADGRQASLEPVTLSAVVVDRDGVPVRNLGPDDFRITENGKPVAVTDFGVVATGASANRGRSVVLILGSSGTDPALTSRVQKIARGFVETAGANDQVSVVRIARSQDELAGDRQDMLMRIAEYRAPMGEPFNAKTSHVVLDLVAKLSRDLMDAEAPRRAIVFVGSPWIYDIADQTNREQELVWPHWVSALTTAARANVSVYVIDPNGLRGRIRINPDGLVAKTGGDVFYNINDFNRAMDRVWRDTSSYYALEYVPDTSKREIQDISVKMTRPGLTVRARRSR